MQVKSQQTEYVAVPKECSCFKFYIFVNLHHKTKSSFLNQELVRLLQQTLRTSQCNRQQVNRPAPAPDSSAASDQTQDSAATQEEIAQSEALLQERDGQIQSLCGHMERLALEKESLQQELKGLKIKVGEINDQLGMLMETIQAKDEVIIKLSHQSSEQSGNPNNGSPPPNKDQQEVDILKVQFKYLYFFMVCSQVCTLIN